MHVGAAHIVRFKSTYAHMLPLPGIVYRRSQHVPWVSTEKGHHPRCNDIQHRIDESSSHSVAHMSWSRNYFWITGTLSGESAGHHRIALENCQLSEALIFSLWLMCMMTSSNGSISPLRAICAGNSPVPGEFPAQRPVTRSFGVCLDLRLNKRLSKQSWGWWFETLLRPLWRHCNGRCHCAHVMSLWSNLLKG